MEIQVLLPKANGKVAQPEYKPSKQNKLYSILTFFCHLSRHYLPIPKTNAAWRLKTPLVYLLNPSLVYLNLDHQMCVCVCVCVCVSRSVTFNSLWPHGLQPPDSSAHGDSPGKNTGVGCHALLQGIFPTQGLNPGLPHCKWIPYQLSYQGSPDHHVYLDLFCDWKVPLCML